jgi:hypothetical protein
MVQLWGVDAITRLPQDHFNDVIARVSHEGRFRLA